MGAKILKNLKAGLAIFALAVFAFLAAGDHCLAKFTFRSSGRSERFEMTLRPKVKSNKFEVGEAFFVKGDKDAIIGRDSVSGIMPYYQFSIGGQTVLIVSSLPHDELKAAFGVNREIEKATVEAIDARILHDKNRAGLNRIEQGPFEYEKRRIDESKSSDWLKKER